MSPVCRHIFGSFFRYFAIWWRGRPEERHSKSALPLPDGFWIDTPILCHVRVFHYRTIMSKNHPRRITHLSSREIFILRLGEEIAAKTVAHRIVRPSINPCPLSQDPEPLRKDINVPLWSYETIPPNVRLQPFGQILRNTYKPPPASFGFDALDFDCPVLNINFRPVQCKNSDRRSPAKRPTVRAGNILESVSFAVLNKLFVCSTVRMPIGRSSKIGRPMVDAGLSRRKPFATAKLKIVVQVTK